MTIKLVHNEELKAKQEVPLATLQLKQGTINEGWLTIMRSDIICRTSHEQSDKGMIIVPSYCLQKLKRDLDENKIAYEIVN